MAALEEGFQYGLSSNSISASNRSVVQVKLTDTSLGIIEEYLRKKVLVFFTDNFKDFRENVRPVLFLQALQISRVENLIWTSFILIKYY